MKENTVNQSQKLYENLRLEILNNYKDGEKFYSIRQLVIKHNLNINTILKVVKRLESEGYLYAKKGKGYFINGEKKIKTDEQEVPLMKNFHSSKKNREEINLANGSPSNEFYPFELYEDLTITALKEYESELLGYQEVQGLESLRKVLADEIEKKDIFVKPENIIITSGTQLALLTIMKMFVDINRKTIGISSPSYPNSFNLMKGIMNIKTFELRDNGWDLVKFEKTLKKEKIDLLYLVVNFHNPTGITWSDEKKKKIVNLAEKYDFYIIEDDCFSDFYYTKRVSTLKSFDKIGKERVIYVKTYSKVMMPDLQLAMMILPPILVERALLVKYCIDHNTSGLRQKVLEYLITQGFLEKYLYFLKRDTKKKYKATLELISQLKGCEIVEKPRGGFFFWIKLPNHITATVLCKKANKEGVNILGGRMFYLEGEKDDEIRLSFVREKMENIQKGVGIIKKILEESELEKK